MKQCFLLLDKYLYSILSNLISMLFVLITLLVFGEVIFRYVLKIPTGGIGELPTVLMILCVWISAGLNFREDTHIRISVMEMFIKNPKILNYLQLIIRFFTLLIVLIFTYLSFGYLRYNIESGVVSPGLRFPQWWSILIMFIGSILMVYYNVKLFIKDIRKVSKWE
ncbi:MAG: TRAP transporter small permease [Atribacterota bacterium]|nr:TRAP transporter small permease [Atribacterota bacterium]